MGYEILIDGYNVIKNNCMFQAAETKSLADARNVLIRQLKNRYRHTTHRVIVVFDGNDTKEQISHDEHIRIVFSRYGETADSVIARLASEAKKSGHTVLSYSDDEEIRLSVAEQGGKIQTTRQLTTHLNAAPHDVAVRSKYRQEMRRAYGIDPSYKPDDEIEPHHQAKRKKKKKSTRRYR